MRSTTRAIVLGAVAIAAALGLSGCGGGQPAQPAQPPSPVESPPIAAPPTAPGAATTAPLPPPSALTDVMARIADVNIPGAQKLDAIEAATPADATAMDKFGQALRDNGYTPATFEATDLRWTESPPGNVLASITVRSANPQAADFSFPMEFRFVDDHWQLARRTADALLHLAEESPTPPAPPAPSAPAPPTPTP